MADTTNPASRPQAQQRRIKAVLRQEADLNFALLVGSRADGTARPDSDWDIALSWNHALPPLERIGRTETLRRSLARALHLGEDKIDLIDLLNANLCMRTLAAEEGLPLSGDDSTAWAIFLRRTWRELEDYYWEQEHAA